MCESPALRLNKWLTNVLAASAASIVLIISSSGPGMGEINDAASNSAVTYFLSCMTTNAREVASKSDADAATIVKNVMRHQCRAAGIALFAALAKDFYKTSQDWHVTDIMVTTLLKQTFEEGTKRAIAEVLKTRAANDPSLR